MRVSPTLLLGVGLNLGCTMAMAITYDEVVVEGEDCDELQDMDGTTEYFGQGPDIIYEEDGVSIYSLYGIDLEEDEGWEEMMGSYSVTYEGVWYFGLEF